MLPPILKYNNYHSVVTNQVHIDDAPTVVENQRFTTLLTLVFNTTFLIFSKALSSVNSGQLRKIIHQHLSVVAELLNRIVSVKSYVSQKRLYQYAVFCCFAIIFDLPELAEQVHKSRNTPKVI